MNIQLISVGPKGSFGANDKIYTPTGLVTIGGETKWQFPRAEIIINNTVHGPVILNPNVEIVGIQITSPDCYDGALGLAREAKRLGKIVVFGGQYATGLFRQVMANQEDVDFIIRGKGEKAFALLVRALNRGSGFSEIPSLSWRHQENIVHNLQSEAVWRYDDYLPLRFEYLSPGIETYWAHGREIYDADYVFQVFTHFGCGYRDRRIACGKDFCTLCSLNDRAYARHPADILKEIFGYVVRFSIPKGSKIILKCYGDNIGCQTQMLEALAKAIRACPWWKDYQFIWVFYAQSSYVTTKLVQLLKAVGCGYVFIGFDAVNDHIQKLNCLGTSRCTHKRAIRLLKAAGIKIQAASVLGLRGETPETLEEQYEFFKSMAEEGVLERTNSGILIITIGSRAYQLLCQRHPEIRSWDRLPLEKMQRLWLEEFSQDVNLELLWEYAKKIDALSPGKAHAHMGWRS